VQQTAAAVVVPLVFKALSAAAAAELGRSTVQSAASITARQGVPAAIVSAKVIGLMKGVLRTMVLTKLNIAMAVVLVAAAVVSARGIVLPEPVLVAGHPQPAKAASPAVDEGGKSKGEPKKAPDEPAWKKEFREKYGLKEDEYVKRIAPPYTECRAEYFRDLIREAYKRNKIDPPEDEVNRAMSDHFTKFGWKDGWPVDQLMMQTTPVKPDEGVTLRQLIHMTTGFGQARTEGDADLLDQKVTGDFVVRAGADPAKVAIALEKILRKECELPISLAVQEVERDMFILSGKYEAKPLDGRKKNEIEVYAKHLVDQKAGGGGTGTFDELVARLEGHVRLPVRVGKIEGLPKEVSWHYNVRSPMVKDPTRHIDTYAEDTNAVMVLDNIASQTGLTVKVEKRKVRVLVVERAKADK
jgi:hypothetical protein